MKSKVLVTSIFFATAVASGPVHASGAVTAHVLAFGTYGNGNVYVSLDQSISEAGCPMPYLELPENGAAAKAVLANAALALATGATITVQTDSCFNGVPSFSGARAAYFVVNNPS